MRVADKRRLRGLTAAIALVLVLACAAGVTWAAAEGGHGAEAGPKGWAATDTYRVMNFVVLAALLFVLLRKPVANAFRNRIKGIQDQLQDLEKRKKEAEKMLFEAEERLLQLDRESEKIVAQYIRQGEDARERILREAEAAAGKIEEQARRNIAHEFEAARLKLQGEILEKALARAEGKIRDRITAGDQEKLVAEYLEKVVAS